MRSRWRKKRLPRRNKRGETLWQSPPFHNKPRRARETAPSACRKRPAAPAFSDGLSLQGCFSALQRRGHHVPVREAHGRNMIAEAACSRSSRRTCRRCGWHRKGLAAPSCIPAEVWSICRYAEPCCARLPNPPRMSPGSDCIWRASALQASPKGAFDGLGASDRLCRKPPFSPLRAASLTGPLRPRPACSPGQIRWCPCSS